MNRLWLAIVKHRHVGTLPMLFKSENTPTERIIKARISPNPIRQWGIEVMAIYDMTALLKLDPKSAQALQAYLNEAI